MGASPALYAISPREFTDRTLSDVEKTRLSHLSTAYNDRFGKPPLSDHDAHRPVRNDEDLELIFTWQEDRKISKELTIHFLRGLYLIEPGPETRGLRGHRCRVHEYADGHLELRHEGRTLPFRAFDEQRRVTQGDIVSNKRLAAVLLQIQADQRKRDEERLASPKVTRRQMERIRPARARADAPVAMP